MNINGFEVDQYNIYNLQEGVKYSICPICSHTRKKKTQKCATINWEIGLLKCSHCGEVVQLHTYKKKSEPTSYNLPEWENKTELSDKVVKWFEGRGISQFILRIMKIGEGVEIMPPNSNQDKWLNKNTIQFPYFRNTECINVKYRAGDKTFKLYKDAEKIPYNLDRIQGEEIIYAVEGEVDVLAAMECGIFNVTSPPNGFTLKGNVNLDWLNNDVEHFINAKKLILAFDQDEAGRNGTKEFIRRFGAHKCFLVDLKDCKDANDYLLKYGKEELKKALENHIEIPLENVSTYKDHKDGVRDFFINGMPKGYVTKTMPNLDKIFSLNSAQPLLVTGIPSHGKSEVVDQIVLSYAINYNFNIAFASPENKPNKLHSAKLIRKLSGFTPDHPSKFSSSFEACEEFIDKHVNYIDIENGYTLDKVLLKAEELVYRRGVKILVIDPFNKVQYKEKFQSITGNKINDYTNAYLTKVYEFCVKFDIIPIIVAHPNKMEKGANGKRVIPDFYDVKGGGEWYDMMPHGLVVYRDFDNNYTLVKTLKVKFNHLGASNEHCYFKYNVNNGRMSPIIVSNEQDIINGNYSLNWDNSNWITKNENIDTQSEIDLNSSLEPNYEFYSDTDSDDVPF